MSKTGVDTYERQTVSLTYAAAKECIAEAINRWDKRHGDWKQATIAEFSEEILRRLGFKSAF